MRIFLRFRRLHCSFTGFSCLITSSFRKQSLQIGTGSGAKIRLFITFLFKNLERCLLFTVSMRLFMPFSEPKNNPHHRHWKVVSLQHPLRHFHSINLPESTTGWCKHTYRAAHKLSSLSKEIRHYTMSALASRKNYD